MQGLLEMWLINVSETEQQSGVVQKLVCGAFWTQHFRGRVVRKLTSVRPRGKVTLWVDFLYLKLGSEADDGVKGQSYWQNRKSKRGPRVQGPVRYLLIHKSIIHLNWRLNNVRCFFALWQSGTHTYLSSSTDFTCTSATKFWWYWSYKKGTQRDDKNI